MERQLLELRLQEERAFLQRAARGPGDGGELRDTEHPPDSPHRRAPAIVPEPLQGDAATPPPTPGTHSQRDVALMAEAVRRSDFLRRLGEGCPEALARSFVTVRREDGDAVVAEGDEGTAMYIVAALGPVRLWAIDRQRFRAIATGNARQRRAEVLRVLRTVRWLQELSDSHLSKLLDAMEECSFPPGHVIIREGDEGKSFYIILKGEVRVSRSEDGREKLLRVLGAGEHFGELSLLQSWRSPRSAQPCPAVQLEELVAVHYEEGQKQGQRVVLGTGGFGRVELVRCRGQLFALKRIRKDWVVRTRQQEHICTERRVLARSHCPFIVGFFGSFRDAQHVYLLLEFCQGGELWTKLREVRCFEEPLAVFCSACVVEGLEYLHGHGIVYRDLKPENLMLDQLGYVKLVDFGFAKELEHGEKTFSFCGTPEYLAPEMLRHEGHDFAVDFWMLGILVFEMLVGRPPFHSADPQTIYSRILDGIFSFPAFLSEAACSLIAKLCRRRPGQRLGNTASGIRGIKKHRWFGAIRWKRLALQQMEAPTVQLLKEVRMGWGAWGTGGGEEPGTNPTSQGPPYANFKRFSVDSTPVEDELSGWDEEF
ncbi:UNVERIFIED_CONTAM: hypothetical protein H355_010766 [Colinus virginianus]|nr:hypothetical protein H355_010766 [Colinus virginianus]